jgi:hypothetical protein
MKLKKVVIDSCFTKYIELSLNGLLSIKDVIGIVEYDLNLNTKDYTYHLKTDSEILLEPSDLLLSVYSTYKNKEDEILYLILERNKKEYFKNLLRRIGF